MSIFHPEVRDEENLIYLARNSNEQNDVSQVTNRQMSKMYYWVRGVVEKAFTVQSIESKEMQENSRGKGAEHEILQPKEKEAIRPEIMMDFKYEVELPDSEKCEYVNASSGICVEMPVVDTKEVHEHFPVLNLESFDDDKFIPDWNSGLYSELDEGEEIAIDHTLFKEECIVAESSFFPEYSSYSIKEKKHKEKGECCEMGSKDVDQGRVTNPFDDITSSADLKELLMSCQSSRVEIENVMARFTKQPKRKV